jgi:hypothetical protein
VVPATSTNGFRIACGYMAFVDSIRLESIDASAKPIAPRPAVRAAGGGR